MTYEAANDIFDYLNAFPNTGVLGVFQSGTDYDFEAINLNRHRRREERPGEIFRFRLNGLCLVRAARWKLGQADNKRVRQLAEDPAGFVAWAEENMAPTYEQY
jgi:hypothetical protein